MSTTTNQSKSKQIDDESNTGSARSSSACFLSHPQKEMQKTFQDTKRNEATFQTHEEERLTLQRWASPWLCTRPWSPEPPSARRLWHWNGKNDWKLLSFFLNPNWASAFGADWLLTCSRRPGWCLHASVCHPERCPSSPCCWPAEAASCRLSAASLQETPSPWQERTDKL